MKIVYFTHSLRSCWNHGNAHFLRGILRDLKRRGHEVIAAERHENWSFANLTRDQGDHGCGAFLRTYPDLPCTLYSSEDELPAILDNAHLVIVHEWNEPTLVAAVGAYRKRNAFTLLFHDTHHRAISDPAAIKRFDLSSYDGVLAFGETLSHVYRKWGWGARVFTWHEAADVSVFRPPPDQAERQGLVWIGNWGDGERSTEIETFLLSPAQAAGLLLNIYGVRYPAEAQAILAAYRARYHGWVANALVPELFGRHLATIHVPRRYYADLLPGIPTIRVFEALACGIPLVSAPWSDTEHLFRPGTDYLVAQNGTEMTRHLRNLAADPDLRRSLAEAGLSTIRNRHSCTHRVDELLAIVGSLTSSLPQRSVA